MTELIHFNAARREIMLARDIDEVKQIRDKAEALRLYVKQQGEGLEMQNAIAEIKIRAERKAGELIQEGQHKGEIAKQGNQPKSNSVLPLTDLGISKIQSSRWQQIADIPDDDFERHIAETVDSEDELTSAGTLRLAKKVARENNYRNKVEPPAMVGKYRVIYADPPWRYDNSGFDQSAAAQYPTMTVEDICALPVAEIADEPSVLYLWATVPLLPEALQVMNAWGFNYKSNRVWKKDRAPGMGWWGRTYHELLLIGASKENYHPTEKLPSVVTAPVEAHSQKPDIFAEEIELVHAGPYIELFARNSRDGWNVWGNEPNVKQ